MVKEFWPRFVPSARLLYLGDTAKKAHFVELEQLKKVGLPYSLHDKLPDLVFHHGEKRWLILVEAVTSHGPCSPKRRQEIEQLLSGNPLHRVYVTAFPSFKEFKRHIDDIAWETEVWLSEIPGHMIHYNGNKFLGPPEAKDG